MCIRDSINAEYMGNSSEKKLRCEILLNNESKKVSGSVFTAQQQKKRFSINKFKVKYLSIIYHKTCFGRIRQIHQQFVIPGFYTGLQRLQVRNDVVDLPSNDYLCHSFLETANFFFMKSLKIFKLSPVIYFNTFCSLNYIKASQSSQRPAQHQDNLMEKVQDLLEPRISVGFGLQYKNENLRAICLVNCFQLAKLTDKLNLISVSYTHLTLPTICSVQILVGAVSLKKKKKKNKIQNKVAQAHYYHKETQT
eukprot:TRINITY_DN29152_c0_g1_i1.p1 TRINITY_DN29152_c0_g1~~TRINITY_DN29152_c0_g1_i1.p1  ORF type:complete len:251 (-),score=40.64 TRINITY_DN29152_c0_g1_i1:7-759(-)